MWQISCFRSGKHAYAWVCRLSLLASGKIYGELNVHANGDNKGLDLHLDTGNIDFEKGTAALASSAQLHVRLPHGYPAPARASAWQAAEQAAEQAAARACAQATRRGGGVLPCCAHLNDVQVRVVVVVGDSSKKFRWQASQNLGKYFDQNFEKCGFPGATLF